MIGRHMGKRLVLLSAAIALSSAAALTAWAKTRLDTVSDLYWNSENDNKATEAIWEEVEDAYQYKVRLYLNESSSPKAEITTKKTSYNFRRNMVTEGEYTFKVQAIAKKSSREYTDSYWSEASEGYYVSESRAENNKSNKVVDTSTAGPGIPGGNAEDGADKGGARWMKDGTNWWYRNADGSRPVNTWQWIDGKCYYFDSNGYMLADTVTPDGYSVNGDGAWVIDGVVQTQQRDGASDLYDNDTNRAALAAYWHDLKNNSDYEWYYDSQNGGKTLDMDPHFMVLDVNADGVYEVFVYGGGPSSAPYWLLYYDNGVKKKEWRNMPELGTLEDGQFFVSGGDHGYFWGERYELKENVLNLLERLEYGLNNAGYETVEQNIKQYTDKMVRYQFVYLSDENLSRYLSGNGESTGVR